MLSQASSDTLAIIREAAQSLTGAANDYDPLMELIGDARMVLLGQASYGTHEFYAARARITRRLIEEKGFTAVAVGTDSTDAFPINRYVRGAGDDRNALAALDGFMRFPTWTWRNAAVLDFVTWLRDHNEGLEGEPPVGFYGLDYYNIHASNEAARGRMTEEEWSFAEDDPLLTRHAERSYSPMFGGQASSWSVRNRHLTEMLVDLAGHLEASVGRGKVVFWAHNTHVGDARATQMGDGGDCSVGQLMREQFGREAVLIGLTTYSGTVRAASEWDHAPEQKLVVPADPASYEALFHEIGQPRFLLSLREGTPAAEALRDPKLERAIGLIYPRDPEFLHHYITARLSDQFDAVVHLDQTTAVHPLEGDPGYEAEAMITNLAPACA
jgi:erythromycin esterase-like protein